MFQTIMRAFRRQETTPLAVEILDHDPEYPEAIRIKGYAVDAYGDDQYASMFAEVARENVLAAAARHFGIDEAAVLSRFTIYVTPGDLGPHHGFIFARPRPTP